MHLYLSKREKGLSTGTCAPPKMTLVTLMVLVRVLPVLLIPNYELNILKLKIKIKTLYKTG